MAIVRSRTASTAAGSASRHGARLAADGSTATPSSPSQARTWARMRAISVRALAAAPSPTRLAACQRPAMAAPNTGFARVIQSPCTCQPSCAPAVA
jgi:hypothetical protein